MSPGQDLKTSGQCIPQPNANYTQSMGTAVIAADPALASFVSPLHVE
jgi:hypothetical protein